MQQQQTPYVSIDKPEPVSPVRARSTSAVFGQVMFLVAVALAFLALGSSIGRDLAPGTALACSIGGFVMLLVASFGGRTFRVGTFAVIWLYALALLIGLGLGPVLAEYLAVDPDAVVLAAGGTTLTVVGMGALGFALSKDLLPWMRPLSLAVFALVLVSIGVLIFSSSALSPILSLGIYLLSAALIAVDFNVLRKHGTEEHAVMLATGIFVSIVNIFLSLLNLFGSD